MNILSDVASLSEVFAFVSVFSAGFALGTLFTDSKDKQSDKRVNSQENDQPIAAKKVDELKV